MSKSEAETTDLAAMLEAAVAEGWRACRRQVYALAEDTGEKYEAVAKRDTEGVQGAFSRGRISEAKSIARALGAFEPDHCTEARKALMALLARHGVAADV